MREKEDVKRRKFSYNRPMPSLKIVAIRFRPPVAVARLGDSRTPLEAFTWADDPRAFGAGQTVIVPRVSFEVLADGSIEPYVPCAIRFKDDGAIRPVCPFFELEAEVERNEGDARREPLTNSLLREAELCLAQLSFEVIAANRKAERRTGDAGCRFEARLLTPATNHCRQLLNAWSHGQTGAPLVLRERPIPLGSFQVMRPLARPSHVRNVDLDTIRVRFTPATGQIYGPPSAVESQTVSSRKAFPIVPPQNRILNPAASWINYDFNSASYPAPRPPDTYDGESDLHQANASWGVVDDTCDVVISASLAVDPKTLKASARVLVGPPDFAPDRRPFYSIADDLADRDPKVLRKHPREATPEERHDAVADLFRRISEVSSMINFERVRYRQIQVNISRKIVNRPDFPEIGDKSMTSEDKIDTDRDVLSLAGEAAISLGNPGAGTNDVPAQPRWELAKTRHEQLGQPEVWVQFLLRDRARVRDILRPPFARFSELAEESKPQTPFEFRDPRFTRSYGFDARMPPYLRDCDMAPLSLTRLQWDLLFPNGIDSEDREPEDHSGGVYG